MKNIGFIGAGNMGGAIIAGLIKNSGISPSEIYVCDKALKEEILSLGINASTLKETVDNAECIVLAVKPNMIFGVIDDIKKECDISAKLFISIAAGLKLCDLAAALGTERIVRVMPNICLKAGEGMSVLCKTNKATQADLDAAQKIFAASGKTAVVGENLIDACTAINGSGPAYVFMFMEALADAAVKHGIDRATAYALSAQTVLGSAALMLDTGLQPGVLKDMVCSPGGTTIEAVQALEDTGLRSSVMAAVDACVSKAIQMGKK